MNSGLSREELLKEHEELIRKVDDLSGKLYRVNNKLKESETLKGHFISNITNEIVNPFASILIQSENIQKLKADEMGKARMMASMIYDEAFNLDFQLKNIFAAAAIEAGKDELKPVTVNLNRLFERNIRLFRKQINSKQLDFELTLDSGNDKADFDTFISDEEKLDLAVKNLLDNAIKYSFEKGRIKIGLSMCENTFTFTIEDNGKGIPGDKKQEIFDRFGQLDKNIHSMNPGHGLGLSIVISYVHSLDGNLKFEDRVQGTSITVNIPALDKNEDWGDLDTFLIDPEQTF